MVELDDREDVILVVFSIYGGLELESDRWWRISAVAKAAPEYGVLWRYGRKGGDRNRGRGRDGGRKSCGMRPRLVRTPSISEDIS